MKLKDICKDKICKGIRIYTDKMEDVIDAYVIETKDVENCSIRYTKPDSIIQMKVDNKFFLKKDDIIIASIPSNNTNHVGYCKDIGDEKVIIKKNFFILRNMDRDKYNPEFVAEYLEQVGIEEAKEKKATKDFVAGDIEEIDIPNIPIEKQNELVALLRPINERNELYHKMIDNCEEIKRYMILEVVKDEK